MQTGVRQYMQKVTYLVALMSIKQKRIQQQVSKVYSSFLWMAIFWNEVKDRFIDTLREAAQDEKVFP